MLLQILDVIADPLDLPALFEQYESPLLRYVTQLLRPGDPEIEDIFDRHARVHA